MPRNSTRTLDRASEIRSSPERLAKLVADADSRVIVHTDDAVLVSHSAGRVALVRRSVETAIALGASRADLSFLGLEDRRAVFALATMADRVGDLGEGEQWLPVLLASMQLPPAERALANHAVGLANWRRRYRFCPRCGQPTRDATDGGHVLVCGSGHRTHPRVEPVVQMLVHDQRRCMLGRAPAWPAGWMSTLAGFVDLGETPEQAVARETKEEAGLDVLEVRYVGAQFWAGPYSLMLGFHARCGDVERASAGPELEHVEAFTPRALKNAMAQGRILAPLPGILAGDLIASWIDPTHKQS
jgi:NAD+ diphosphatase